MLKERGRQQLNGWGIGVFLLIIIFFFGVADGSHRVVCRST